jgi:hypothetical protein
MAPRIVSNDKDETSKMRVLLTPYLYRLNFHKDHKLNKRESVSYSKDEEPTYNSFVLDYVLHSFSHLVRAHDFGFLRILLFLLKKFFPIFTEFYQNNINPQLHYATKQTLCASYVWMRLDRKETIAHLHLCYPCEKTVQLNGKMCVSVK